MGKRSWGRMDGISFIYSGLTEFSQWLFSKFQLTIKEPPKTYQKEELASWECLNSDHTWQNSNCADLVGRVARNTIEKESSTLLSHKVRLLNRISVIIGNVNKGISIKHSNTFNLIEIVTLSKQPWRNVYFTDDWDQEGDCDPWSRNDSIL